ncbi:MAG: sigma-54-dependent transcriptional regulator [Planctomycetota bacterium]|jgi:two-component system nitrogen regulation response regulator NtrX
MAGATILVCDDEPQIRESLKTVLNYEGYHVVEAARAEEALEKLEKVDPDLLLLDIKMPGMDGLTALSEIHTRRPQLPVVMISGHGTVETAVEATKRGAFDFLEKPPDADRLVLAVRNALSTARLRDENRQLKQALATEVQMLGATGGLQPVLETVERVAPTEASVLITGENGSGKELVARAVHAASQRSGKPFVDVNCAAIPGELIESVLFGHEAGAFTGATQRQRGKFEQAHGGTLFLDEVGDMSLAAQAKILRVLETREVERVGGAAKTKVDVRVLAATNKDLQQAVTDNEFREDLYYRLNVVPIRLPPLRERRDDIGVLAAEFLAAAVVKHGLEERRFAPAAIKRLGTHDWPGNVRQLKNLCERLAIISPDTDIDAAAVDAALEPPRAGTAGGADPLDACATFEEWKEAAERRFLERRLAGNDWNIKRTAEQLKMQRSNLYKKIEKYGLK